MRNFNTFLVTGGCGFVGTNFIRYLLEDSCFGGRVVNLDALTYAGNRLNLIDIEEKFRGRYFFEKADICDFQSVCRIMEKYEAECIVHFAAESHVDRSVCEPADFIRTNINGTFMLLEAALKLWGDRQDRLFHHISTDEVFGSLGEKGSFTEKTAYDPKSPYSASKASSDHLVRAYHNTYGLNSTITICSNNYGEYQFPEKLIPLMIINMLEGRPLPLYGDGKNVRDWIYVKDHCEGILKVIAGGRSGQSYNIGGAEETDNLSLVKMLCRITAELTGKKKEEYESLITFVKDRPGHDGRYSVDFSKIRDELGFCPVTKLEPGLKKTVFWYIKNHKK